MLIRVMQARSLSTPQTHEYKIGLPPGTIHVSDGLEKLRYCACEIFIISATTGNILMVTEYEPAGAMARQLIVDLAT